MPFGDRTGPMGAGSMTGRRAGYCVGSDRPGSLNLYRGLGCGMGRGGGRGWRHRVWAACLPGRARSSRPFGWGLHHPAYAIDIQPEDEIKLLRNQTKRLESSLTNLKDRIAELAGASDERK